MNLPTGNMRIKPTENINANTHIVLYIDKYFFMRSICLAVINAPKNPDMVYTTPHKPAYRVVYPYGVRRLLVTADSAECKHITFI